MTFFRCRFDLISFTERFKQPAHFICYSIKTLSWANRRLEVSKLHTCLQPLSLHPSLHQIHRSYGSINSEKVSTVLYIHCLRAATHYFYPVDVCSPARQSLISSRLTEAMLGPMQASVVPRQETSRKSSISNIVQSGALMNVLASSITCYLPTLLLRFVNGGYSPNDSQSFGIENLDLGNCKGIL